MVQLALMLQIVIQHRRYDRLDQALRPRTMGPNAHDGQAHTLQQVGPVLFRALARRHERHHQPIEPRGPRVSAPVRDHELVDEEFAVTGLHGGDEMAKDVAAFLIGPVVEDGVHEVSTGAWERHSQLHGRF